MKTEKDYMIKTAWWLLVKRSIRRNYLRETIYEIFDDLLEIACDEKDKAAAKELLAEFKAELKKNNIATE